MRDHLNILPSKRGRAWRYLEEVLRRHKETPNNECWIWPHAKRNGYPLLTTDGQQIRAGQIICICVYGLPPDGRRQCLHSCDNPPCVNPAHLRWGNDADNRADAISRGRHKPPPNNVGYRTYATQTKGELHHSAKLTADDVRVIRASDETQTDLAARYGVSQAAIYSILHFRSWRHVK